jgi:hypothetical protein
MATQYAFGKIVTNGLILALDAADKNSYPGSGTTWTDLSGNGNNGTLTNGPTFSSDNGGSIVFDGTNDYISLPNIAVSTLPAFSVCFWARTSIGTGNPAAYSEGTPASWASNLFIIYYGDNTITQYPGALRVWFGFPTISSPLIGVTNVINRGWNYVTYIQTSTSSRRIYLNAILEASNTTTITSTASSASIGAANNNGTITQYFNGNISNLMTYNRALTELEMLQNYNSQKSRFNL